MSARSILAGLVVLTVMLTGCSLDSFLFNADSLSSYELRTTVIPDTSRVEVQLASDGETLYGFFVRQPDSLRIAPHPTIIYHHGNRNNLQYYWDRVELLYRAGFDVFIYDYRGFGKSTGRSSQDGLYADASAALRYVLGRTDVDSSVIVHYGYSLGGVPALYSASVLHKPHALITEAIFMSGETLMQSGTLLNIPGDFLLEGAFNNAQYMRDRTCPVLILHGTDDTFIDIEQNGQALYDIAARPRTFIRVNGAGHNNIPTTLGEQQYIERIIAFIRGS